MSWYNHEQPAAGWGLMVSHLNPRPRGTLMSERFVVEYLVPVRVVVNTATRTVERVTVAKSEVQVADAQHGPEIWTAQGALVVNAALRTKVRQIADQAKWPPWCLQP